MPPAVPWVLTRYLVSAGLARTADEGVRISLILLALERLHSASMGGIFVAALLIPHVVAAPLIGGWTDRSRHPRWLLSTSVVAFAASLFAVAQLAGHAPEWLIVLVLIAGGCCGPVITGGLTSQIPNLVDPSRTARAFGLDSLVYNLAGMAGPAIVGVVTVFAGAGRAQIVLAACAAAAALGILSLPTTAHHGPVGERAELWAGLREIWRRFPLRVVTVTSAGAQLGLGALPVASTLLAVSLHRAADAGLLMSCVAAGALVGSLLWIWRPTAPARAAVVTAVSMIGMGAPLAFVGLAPSTSVAAILFGASGFFVGPFGAALFTTRDHYADPGVRAQVFTIGAGLKVTAAAAGAVLIGMITDVPIAMQLVLVAVFPVVSGGLALMILRRVREQSGRLLAEPTGPGAMGQGPRRGVPANGLPHSS